MAFAIGQSTGAFAALIVNFGWSTLGPSLVARASDDERRAIHGQSLVTRGLIALVLLPAAGLVAALLAPSQASTAAATAIGAAAVGLLPSWYLIGVGSPGALAVLDTIPRVAVAVVVSLLLPTLPWGALYGSLLFGAVSVSTIIASIRYGGSTSIRRTGILRVLRGHAALVASGLVAGGYTSLSTSIVAIFSPASVAVFAAGYRFRDLAWGALTAITNATQGWVGTVDGRAQQTRQRVAFRLNLIGGVALGCCITAALPFADDLLFSGEFAVSGLQAAAVGLAIVFGATSMSTTFHYLAPAGRAPVIAWSGTIAAIVGLVAVPAGAVAMGATGALYGIVLSESVNAVIQLSAVRSLLRSSGKATVPTAH